MLMAREQQSPLADAQLANSEASNGRFGTYKLHQRTTADNPDGNRG